MLKDKQNTQRLINFVYFLNKKISVIVSNLTVKKNKKKIKENLRIFLHTN